VRRVESSGGVQTPSDLFVFFIIASPIRFYEVMTIICWYYRLLFLSIIGNGYKCEWV